MREPERTTEEARLLAQIGVNWPRIQSLHEQVNDKWACEDLVYRFYHQSFKVYGLQQHTHAIVDVLQSLAPHLRLNKWFLEIVQQGTGKEFRIEDNSHWLESTRGILEAFFHARYFLEMICKYGKQFQTPPTSMPSGWAAVLYLYNLR